MTCKKEKIHEIKAKVFLKTCNKINLNNDTEKENNDTEKENNDTEKENNDTKKENIDTEKENNDTEKENKFNYWIIYFHLSLRDVPKYQNKLLLKVSDC